MKKFKSCSYDGCMDKEVIELCDALNCLPGVETEISCSGHGKEPPNIIIGQGYKEKDITKIKKIIKSIDDRYWIIYQWGLVRV